MAMCEGVCGGLLFSAVPAVKTETFERDPNWEGHNNRITPKQTLIVKQDFGYSATSHAGKTPGEVGGRIQRSTTPAAYASEVPVKTLGAESVMLALKPGVKKQGATLDRFGLFTSQAGGQMAKIFLDDLSYTADAATR